MPLGWIDFSRSERNKVLSVLDMLSEAGTLDELGIAPIRDGFANLFFPGTSTVQTRAKYFLIVPYILKDMEHEPESNLNRLLSILNECEKECAEQFLKNNGDQTGIIGSRSLVANSWVKRTPVEIYWSGLRNYGIFTDKNLSFIEYFRIICSMKKEKINLKNSRNRGDKVDEKEYDDRDAGEYYSMHFWNIPTYVKEWRDNLNIKLSKDEGKFLKKQIITSFPESMMSYILENNQQDILACNSFKDLCSIIQIFPSEMQRDYKLADEFSDFLYVIRTIYNLIVSDEKNEKANSEWERLQGDLETFANVDLESIFQRLQVKSPLCEFLRTCQKLMYASDLEGMKVEICRRERKLKDASRAKTMHPGEFDPKNWYGGEYLDYRLANAKVIMNDIFESEGTDAESK